MNRKANILIAAIAILAVSAASIMIVTSLSHTRDAAKEIKHNIASKYTRESTVALVLDEAVMNLRDARAYTKTISIGEDCNELLKTIQNKVAPGGTFKLEDPNYLTEDMLLPETLDNLIKTHFGRNADIRANCFISSNIEVTDDVETDVVEMDTPIPLKEFELTVDLSTKKYDCTRTWTVENASVVVTNVSSTEYEGRIDLSSASFVISESNIE